MTSTIQLKKSEEIDLIEQRLINKLPDEESRNNLKVYIQLKSSLMNKLPDDESRKDFERYIHLNVEGLKKRSVNVEKSIKDIEERECTKL